MYPHNYKSLSNPWTNKIGIRKKDATYKKTNKKYQDYIYRFAKDAIRKNKIDDQSFIETFKTHMINFNKYHDVKFDITNLRNRIIRDIIATCNYQPYGSLLIETNQKQLLTILSWYVDDSLYYTDIKIMAVLYLLKKQE